MRSCFYISAKVWDCTLQIYFYKVVLSTYSSIVHNIYILLELVNLFNKMFDFPKVSEWHL